jgi:hypothetical protein
MNYFAIQTNNPIANQFANEEVEYLYEAIERIFPDSTEEAYLIWNWVPIRVSYKYDLYVMIDDILTLLNSLIASAQGSHEVFWGSNTLNAIWKLEWVGEQLKIESEWNMVAGNYESLLNSRSQLKINKNIFLSEWKSFLQKIIEKVDYSEIKIKDYDNVEMLHKIESSINKLGRLYIAADSVNQ